MTSFKNRVRDAGYSGDVANFYEEVETLKQHIHPDESYEQLTRHPRVALRFCDAVRAELKLPDLADEVILGAIENNRKAKRKLAKPSSCQALFQ